MNNILIITSSFDKTADYFISKHSNNINYFRINSDHFSHYDFAFDNYSWTISCKEFIVNGSTIDAIYYRKPTFPNLDNYKVKYRSMMQKDMLCILYGIMESFKGKCLTKPSILMKAENKPYQLLLASKIGFIQPESLITNSSESANKFSSNTSNIIKPLTTGKIFSRGNYELFYTNTLDNSIINDIELSPIYVQRYIPKDFELRVTIINGQVFPVKIYSKEKIDWRKAIDINYEITKIPSEITKKCFQMLDALDLKFGAFDFIINNGEFYFLEVNPNGQWLWLEKLLQLNISGHIISYLAGI